MSSALYHVDRHGLFDRLDKNEIILRYRRNYKLGDQIGLQEIKRHAFLEGELTDELSSSDAENRALTFARAYSRLYSELPWLTASGTNSGAETWMKLLRSGTSVYEIGSGSGYLINYLSHNNFKCIGTDISPERADVAKSSSGNVIWQTTDGVYLTRYAETGAFDYVLSDQVVEHLHPDDIITHFKEARKLLKPGGEYIVRTPYAPLGPADLSMVFGWDKPIFMHLHEFTFTEILSIAREAGFKSITSVFIMPKTGSVYLSPIYTKYSLVIDRLVCGRKLGLYRNTVRRFRKIILLRRNIFVSLKN